MSYKITVNNGGLSRTLIRSSQFYGNEGSDSQEKCLIALRDRNFICR